MMSGFSRYFVILLIAGAGLLMTPALAGSYTTVPQGGTIFLGEQGLDVSAALGNDTSIGWWASGAAIATSAPSSTVQVTTPTNFYVSPTQFGSNTGTWYRLTAQGKPDDLAFYVTDPVLNIKALDTTVNVDASANQWVPRGDQVSFEIDTNLNPVFQRGLSSSEGMDIKVQAPDGGQYSALIDSFGTTHPLQNLAVTTSTYVTGPIWDTGNSVYPAGTYTIWVECNVNSMKDNYGVTGKTISSQRTLRSQEQNPLISVNVPTTSATTAAAQVTSTTSKPTLIPTTSAVKTTPVTTVPVVTTTVPATPAPTTTTPAETQSPKSPGFGALISVVSLAVLAVLLVRHRH